MLAAPDIQRYARQILLADVGRQGQARWLASHVSAVGGGAALAVAIEQVRAAGVTVDDAEVAGAPASEAARGRASSSGFGSRSGAAGIAGEIGGLWLGESVCLDPRVGCAKCRQAFLAARPPPLAEEGYAVEFAVGSAAASELLLRLLDPSRPAVALAFTPVPHRARVHRTGCPCQP